MDNHLPINNIRTVVLQRLNQNGSVSTITHELLDPDGVHANDLKETVAFEMPGWSIAPIF